MLQKSFTPPLLIFAATSLGFSASAAETKGGGVRITEEHGKLVIKIGGQLFSEYHYSQYDGKDVPRPFFYPVIAAGEVPITRNYPMKNVENEAHDHPHHRSLWYAHGDINGHDFWAESPKSGKTVHVAFTEIKSGQDMGVIKSQNKLVAVDGTVVGTDDRTVRIYNRPNDRMLDFEITFHASHGELTFGDTKEGSMSIRINESMLLSKPPAKGERKRRPGEGHIVNSEGIRDGQTWGKRAKWCDYFGPVDGKVVGVAIFDHPQNPRHPTWWHVRDYGLFGANPFGRHDFESLPDRKAGNLVVSKGDSVTFRYCFYFHQGDEKQGKVAEQYEEFARSKVAGTEVLESSPGRQKSL
ncbi:MAG: PmoA family protein [Verrucomicrobia bacterium]|nr:PmoA family protein [Verrucomicrobiota bacterium]